MRTHWVLLSTITSCLLIGGALSATPPVNTPAVSPPVVRDESDPRFTRYTLASGTALQILLQTPINTGVNQPNDPVEGIMTKNLYLGNRLILSKNTRFNGIISRLDPAIQGRDAILGIRFTEIMLDNGEKLPLETHVRTEHPEHIWGGKVTPGTKPMLSTQRVWGIGEYNRIVFGGPRAMGAQIDFLPGEHWTIILEQPLTLVLPIEEE